MLVFLVHQIPHHLFEDVVQFTVTLAADINSELIEHLPNVARQVSTVVDPPRQDVMRGTVVLPVVGIRLLALWTLVQESPSWL
jgi:hypothetical protein